MMNDTKYENMTDDYNDSLSIFNSCTYNGNNIFIIIPNYTNSITNNTLWPIIFMLNEFNGIYIN